MEEQIQQKEEVVEKKSKWVMWLIVALVVIGAGIGIYFLFSGGGLSSVPQPPALPS